MSAFHVLGILAIILLGILLFLVLAEPGLAYRVERPACAIDSGDCTGTPAMNNERTWVAVA